ncbi:MAG: DNA polymerase Y family protein, partial [Gammaproteobacteria bacterium]
GKLRNAQVQGKEKRGFPSLGKYVGRGVVTTATYEARALGVHSGMGLMKAAALAPQAVLLSADFEEYRRYSHLFKAAVAEIAPRIEDRGIDEITIDLTNVPGEAIELAQRIKDRVRLATGLSCSLGLAPNKLLAKLASDLEKPDGLTVLALSDLPTRIWPLPTRTINGIGPRASAKLEALGIRTIGELAATAEETLVETFGKRYANWLLDAAYGRDERPVLSAREPKSLSREVTFERDLHPRGDRETLTQILFELAQRLSGDLSRKGYLAKTIGIKLRYENFRTLTRAVTLERAIADAEAIRSAARACLKRVTLDRRLRLLGIRVAGLVRPGLQGPDHSTIDRASPRVGKSAQESPVTEKRRSVQEVHPI